MGGDEIMKRRKLSIACLIIGMVLLLGGLLVTRIDGTIVQFVTPTSSRTEVTLEEMGRSLTDQLYPISDSIYQYTILAKKQNESLTSEYGEITATLYAINGDYFDFRFQQLICGRYIRASDIEKKRQVAVIDDRAKLLLFPGQEAIGKTLQIDCKEYEVVGIIREGQHIGECDAYCVYIPLTAASENAIRMNVIECLISGANNSAFNSVVGNTLRSWSSEGSFYSLARERLAALMPLYVSFLLFAILVICKFITWLRMHIHHSHTRVKNMLMEKYINQCWTKIVVQFLPAVAGCISIIIAISFVLKMALNPLYIFTDWVPENLMEATSWLTRFWALNQQGAYSSKFVSREVYCIELGAKFILWGMVFVLISVVTWARQDESRSDACDPNKA